MIAGAAVTAGALALGLRKRRVDERRRVLVDSFGPDVCERMHRQKLERIAAQLRAHDPEQPVSLKKQAPPHQVPKFGDLRRHDKKIDISDLTSIISIDPVRRICVAESGVMFEDLVEATLQHGLVPVVVPELKTITVGGAVSGCSIESMSFRYGGFHDSCVEYEVVTANGDVLTCTPENQNALVFQMMRGSFGTLGILTKLAFHLVPATPYVHVIYEKYGTLSEYRAAIWRHFKSQDIDFMDGIIHSPTEYVLSTAKFVERAPYTNRYDWMKIYYQSTRERKEDYLRTQHYFFRYDRGVTNVHPKSFLGRLFLGKLLDSGTVLKAANKLEFLLDKEHPTVTLDIFLPMSRVNDFMVWYERELNYFPLWCVPYRRVRDYEWLDDSFYKGLDDELFLDLAIYGLKQDGKRNYHRMIERQLRRLGGVKTLISHNYYERSEFWSIWNKRNYDLVKRQTDPRNVFRDLYTKTCRAAMGVRDDGAS